MSKKKVDNTEIFRMVLPLSDEQFDKNLWHRTYGGKISINRWGSTVYTPKKCLLEILKEEASGSLEEESVLLPIC